MTAKWTAILVFILAAFPARAQGPDALVKQATAAWGGGDLEKAFELVGKALDTEPNHKAGLFVRGSLWEAKAGDLKGQALLDAYAAGVRDFGKLIELAPKEPEGYHSRGCLHFKLGKIEASVADFDRFLELRPERRPSHWQRGITCYCACQLEEGKKQFEGYQDFDANDVENAVWRFLCMARKDGIDRARQAMLKIGPDKRVPMREIYDLYLGQKKPEDVLAAAQAGAADKALRNRQLFYAHLYLGIWHDLTGEREKALDHLNRAADEHRIGHYMWDVARVHRDRLQGKKR